jgi:hypothetical protein
MILLGFCIFKWSSEIGHSERWAQSDLVNYLRGEEIR